LLRKARNVVKGAASLAPVVSGGLDEQRAAVNDTEASEAYKQLEALAEAQRGDSAVSFFGARAFKANPELSKGASASGGEHELFLR
jgi:DNA-binding MurR/RpiR family transcriptional regulator